jgi:GTPase
MQKIYGNVQGIKASQIKRLQELYEQNQPADRFITPEFAQALATISQQIHHPICCYLNRRGQVIRIAIGTPNQTQIPPEELPRRSAERLSGIRCVATQVKSEPPGEAALIAMMRQRLDALVMLTAIDGEVKEAFLAYLFPDSESPWVISPPLSLDDLTEEEFDELVEEWEREIVEAGDGIFLSEEIVSDQDRVLLVGVQTEDISVQRFEDGLAELVRLVESAGGIVLDTMRQKRDRAHPQTVVGKGKIEEITLFAHKLRANLIVFDRDISASQARNLEQEEEVVEANAMIHVVDLSHPAWESHIASVLEILEEMPGIPEKNLIAFNKVDKVDSETWARVQQNYPQAVFISATQRLGLETLKVRSLQLIDEPVKAIAVPQNSY